MDKILLGLFVAVTGSLFLPAMQLARVIVPRRARRAPGHETIREIKEKTDLVPLAPAARAERFRPLTAEEKKEFGNPSIAKRKPGTSKPRVYFPSPTIVPDRMAKTSP